jgi:hypothetical protein
MGVAPPLIKMDVWFGLNDLSELSELDELDELYELNVPNELR